MRSEAECLRATNIPHLVFCVGGSPGRARACAERLIEKGASRLLSFGVAGGLDKSLESGALVLADAVIDQDGTEFPTDTEWRHGLASLYPVTEGAIVTIERPAASIAEKCRLSQRTNAIAVDMESAGVAYVARENGVPFMALRAIADDASRAIPQCALSGLKEDGSTRPIAVLSRLAFRPWELVPLLQLAGDTKRAMNSLSRVAATGF